MAFQIFLFFEFLDRYHPLALIGGYPLSVIAALFPMGIAVLSYNVLGRGKKVIAGIETLESDKLEKIQTIVFFYTMIVIASFFISLIVLRHHSGLE